MQVEPYISDIGMAGYLWACFASLGITEDGANGPVPVSWQSIHAWAKTRGEPLQPWELDALRVASAAYVGQWYAAKDVSCLAPYQNMELVDRDAVAKNIRSMLGGRT